MSYKRIHSATYKRRIDSYLGKTLGKMSRAQLIKFGKMKVQKELENRVEMKGMISRHAQLRKTLKKVHKQENQTSWNRIIWSKPADTEAINSIEFRAVDNTVSLSGDPLNITEFNNAKPSNRSQLSETKIYPDEISIDSDSETLSEQYCFTEFCKVVTDTSAKHNTEDKCLNPRVVLTDINKLLETENKTLAMKRMFEKKWTALNTEVSVKDNFFHQIQGITSLKMKLWQRYLKYSGNVYYFEKLRNPVLESVRATTEVTAPKDSLTGRCGYFEHCNRIYAFKLFHGRAIKSQGTTGSERIIGELESKVAACKRNFEKQWTARIPGVAPKDNYFDRIQKLESLKLNTCERYLKIDRKLYYFEKLQNALQERVRYSTVTTPAKQTLDGRCGYFQHGRNGLYLFKLVEENLMDDHVARVVNALNGATRSTSSNATQTKTSTSRTNCGKLKKPHVKVVEALCDSIFDIFGTNYSKFVDVSSKNKRKRKYSTNNIDGESSRLEVPEELCWEVLTTGGDAVRIKAKRKCLKSALYGWTPSRADSPLNSLPRNANNVILPRTSPVNGVISSRRISPHGGTDNVASPRRILPCDAKNVVSPTKTSGTNVLKRVLIVKSRNSSQKSLISASQNENRVSGSNNTTPKQLYSRMIATGRMNLSMDKDVLLVPPLLEGPPCHSVVKVNKTGQQCIVKGRPLDLLC